MKAHFNIVPLIKEALVFISFWDVHFKTGLIHFRKYKKLLEDLQVFYVYFYFYLLPNSV